MNGYNLKEIQADLLKKGIIDLQGFIDGEMANYVRTCLMILKSKGSPEVTIEITSDGGNVNIALDIFDMLRLYEGQKTGKVIGYARSMAVIVLQACEKRLCARHAHILIHNIKREISLDTVRSRRKMKKEIYDLEKIQSRIYSVLCFRAKKGVAIVKKTCAKDQNITAKEALEFGLIDKII